jgi:hypothetical protein
MTITDLDGRERLLFLPLIVGAILLGVAPSLVTDVTAASVDQVIGQSPRPLARGSMDLGTSFAAQLGLAAPELILAVSAMAILVGGAFGGRGSSTFAMWSSVLALGGAAVAAAWGDQGVGFRGGFIADDIAAFAKASIYGMSALAVILGERWLKRMGNAQFEFPVLILLAALGDGASSSRPGT